MNCIYIKYIYIYVCIFLNKEQCLLCGALQFIDFYAMLLMQIFRLI